MAIEEKPWFEWMEGAVKAMYDLDPNCMMFAARLKDGSTLTAYYKALSEDKAVMVHHVQNDIMHDFIRANADIINDYLGEAEGAEDEEE